MLTLTLTLTVLGDDTARKTLGKTPLASATREKFGKQCTLAFNWNQLHQWKDLDGKHWFLKSHTQSSSKKSDQHVQYPVYTSALYNRLPDDSMDVKVKVRGKPVADVLKVCTPKHDLEENDPENEGAHWLWQSMWRFSADPNLGYLFLFVLFVISCVLGTVYWLVVLHYWTFVYVGVTSPAKPFRSNQNYWSLVDFYTPLTCGIIGVVLLGRHLGIPYWMIILMVIISLTYIRVTYGEGYSPVEFDCTGFVLSAIVALIILILFLFVVYGTQMASGILGNEFSRLQKFFGHNTMVDDVAEGPDNCGEFNFVFDGLTVGQVASASPASPTLAASPSPPPSLSQVASASSAAAGGGAVPVWVQNAMELARHKMSSTFPGGMSEVTCNILTTVVKKVVTACNPDIVLNEFRKLIGCKMYGEKEHSAKTARRWSTFLQPMAIKMDLTNSKGENHPGHMAIDAV